MLVTFQVLKTLEVLRLLSKLRLWSKLIGSLALLMDEVSLNTTEIRGTISK